MSRLLSYLPPYERNSEIFKEITKVEEKEFNKLDLDLKDLEKQFIVDTATWGLSIYEKELKLPIGPNKTLDERRSIIKAKMRGMGKVDLIMIKGIVEAFTSNIVEVEFNGRIRIVFTNQDKIPLNSEAMFHAIEEIKPSHLNYEFEQRLKSNLKLQTSYNKYEIQYPLCGTYLCGTHPSVVTEGLQLQGTNLGLETKHINAEHHYPLTGESITKE